MVSFASSLRQPFNTKSFDYIPQTLENPNWRKSVRLSGSKFARTNYDDLVAVLLNLSVRLACLTLFALDTSKDQPLAKRFYGSVDKATQGEANAL
jgi:hypothetical protein